MHHASRRVEALASLSIVALSSLMCLGLSAEAPEVELSQMRLIDEGQDVIVRGLLVDLHRYDGGLESIVVASSDGQYTLRVFVQQGVKTQPSAYARIGDSLRAFGRVAHSGSDAILYSSADDVSVEARSEKVLTVDTLGRTWPLLLGDELRLRGVAMRPLGSGDVRLYDADFSCSIALTGAPEFPDVPVALDVVVCGELRLDEVSMRLTLVVTEFAPSG